MMVAMFGQQGEGGRIFYGYREIAVVQTWKYLPTQDGKGEGTIEVTLSDIHPLYANRSDVTVELRRKAGGVLRWESAEMMSDECLVVASAPKTRT